MPRQRWACPPPIAALIATVPAVVNAHGVTGRDASFLQLVDGPAIGPFMYLGAKHMVTGYDHLLFLVGVIFFLYRLKDVVRYVSLFTIGHSVTLLAGVLGNVHANAYIIVRCQYCADDGRLHPDGLSARRLSPGARGLRMNDIAGNGCSDRPPTS